MDTHQLDLPDDLRASLEAAVEAIVRIAQPELVILFGSWAEGRAEEGSDVDLLVVADTEDRRGLSRRLRQAVEPLLAPCPVDIIVTPAADWPRARRLRGFVSHEADRYGVRLHASAA